MDYDFGNGNILETIDYNGYTSLFDYDGLGRLLSRVGPKDSWSQPSKIISYIYGTSANPVSTVLTEHLTDREEGIYFREWKYSDGWGNVRMAVSENETNTGYIVSEYAKLGARGKKTHKYNPYESDSFTFSAPSSDNKDFTAFYFDAKGRVQEQYKSQLTDKPIHDVIQFYPLETHIYSERDVDEDVWDFPAIVRLDGQGRKKEIVRFNGEPGAVEPMAYTFGYDPYGNISSWSDPEGNTRTFTYDSRSKILTLEDPNVGTVEYEYDTVGNEVLRVDSLGQIVEKTYGFGNRLLKLEMKNQSNGEPDQAFEYHYDVVSNEMPDAQNVFGLLSSVEGPENQRFFSYDENGKVIHERHQIKDLQNSTADNEVRQSFDVYTEYSARGWITERQLPNDVRIRNTYNHRNLPTQIEVIKGDTTIPILANARYDAKDRSIYRKYGNDTQSCQFFDLRGNMVGIRSGLGDESFCDAAGQFHAGAFLNLDLTYNAEGLPITVDDISASFAGVPSLDANYRYDRLNQLTEVSTPDYLGTYDYDAIQNMTERLLFPNTFGVQTGPYNYGENGAGPNQLTSTNKSSFSYDAMGHMEQYQDYELLYNSRGFLSEATHSSRGYEKNYYDDQGKILAHEANPLSGNKKVDYHIFSDFKIVNGEPVYLIEAKGKIAEVKIAKGPRPGLYQLDNLIAYSQNEEENPKPLSRELLDWNIDGGFDYADVEKFVDSFWDKTVSEQSNERLVVRYLHPDVFRNTSYVTDSDGDLVSHSTFLPYGRKRSSHGVPSVIGYGGSLNESTDLELMRIGVRFYASDIGKWISPDPAFLSQPKVVLGDVLQGNPYIYVSNNPLIYIDENGLVKIKVMVGLGDTYGTDAAGGDWEVMLGGEYDSRADGSSFTLVAQAGYSANVGPFATSGSVQFAVPLDGSGYSVSGKKSYKAGMVSVDGSVSRDTKGEIKNDVNAGIGGDPSAVLKAVAEKFAGRELTLNAGVVKAKVGIDFSTANGGELTFKGELFGNVSGVPLKGSIEFTLTKEDADAIRAAGGDVFDFAKGEIKKLGEGIVKSAEEGIARALE